MDISPHILANGGWMPMDMFMEAALYDETQGYYSNTISTIGYRGDFSTSATISELPARRLVAQWKECCRACGRRLPFLEVGGGNGDLAMSIARQLSWLDRLRVRYLMVDRSPTLRRLQGMVGGNFVSVYPTIEQALKRADGRAFIFCNELPDAFPARQFAYQGGEWLELGIAAENGHFVRQAMRRPLPESTAFSRWAREGQVIEVHESYHRWYAQWQPRWKCGCFVTIDYGETVETLYHRRPTGTLRGYKAHTLLTADELPALSGRCDITADVNFSDLIALARSNTRDVVQYMSQRDYLKDYARAGDAADHHLIAVPGAGDHFNVLIQHRFGD